MTKKAKILIVDDERDVRSALRRTLRELDVIEADCADDALAILATEKVDAVISDYDMKGGNGLDLLQRVRIRYPAVVRILLTGRASIPVVCRALNERTVDRILLKPWTQVDLKGVVDLALHCKMHPVVASDGAVG